MSGIPLGRHRKIIQAVRDHGSVTIEQLMALTGVSHMTIHRDLHALAAQGLLRKTHGGATSLIEVLPGDASPGAESSACAMCGQAISPRVGFTVRLTSGQSIATCCAHCGLSGMQHTPMDDVRAILTRDFLYQQTLDARDAWFVIDSQVALCCRPGVLCFATRDDATRFQAGFGGSVHAFADAMRRLTTGHARRHAHSG
ncbi:MAG: DeoR family transcriptional regulator [Pleurocapsa minor GSE-CHR-MK-17-07R]|jgi:nitrous oxide reductase accessory protein NosL|nr:DeoR family transcriptional regulator [Pleurocapsa minor GSE-CHR-MK 17-07R]